MASAWTIKCWSGLTGLSQITRHRLVSMLAVGVGAAILTVLWHMPEMGSRGKSGSTASQRGAGAPSQQVSMSLTGKALAVTSYLPAGGASARRAPDPDKNASVQAPCYKSCVKVLDLLRRSVEVSDDQSEYALGLTGELVAYLKNNPAGQRELIAIALQSSDNARGIIIAAFTQLDPYSQWQLGRALIDSYGRAKRLDGVQLLASSQVINESLIPYFEQMYSSEHDEYLREAIVSAFNRPELFRGNSQVLDLLTMAMQSDTDNSVRGEALLASVRLNDDADFAVTQSVAAIRSQSGVYQDFGARALTEFLNRHTRSGNTISWQHTNEIEQLMSGIMSAEFDNMPALARLQLDKLYARFF